MIEPADSAAGQARYELLFTGLFSRGRRFAFPCNAQGIVDINELSDGERANYLFARAVVGRELSAPVVSRVP